MGKERVTKKKKDRERDMEINQNAAQIVKEI